MRRRLPSDHLHRHRACTALDSSLAVEAGAGSGKTSVLVERLVNLLLAGVAPARIAAVTFTERAAGELRERVYDRLEHGLRNAIDDPDSRARLAHALDHLDEMQVSTIHAFCRGLLTSEALDTGWAPGTTILGEGLSPPIFESAFASWRTEFDARHDAETVLAVYRHTRSKDLRDAAARLVEYRDLRPDVGPDAVDWDEARESLRGVTEPLRIAFAQHCMNPDGCKLFNKNAALVESLITALRAADPRAGILALLADGEKGNLAGGRKGDWSIDIAGVRQQLKTAREWKDEWRARVLVPVHTAVVCDLHVWLLPEVERRKRQAACADFTDLLMRTARALRRDGELRARLARSFDALLVDEVQDTDPLQAEIAMLLARAPLAEGEWSVHPPQPGGLFVVGDPKQSIYRFRRADIAMWQALRAAVAGAEQDRVRLAQNFRSVPGLIAWFAHTFAELPEHHAQVAWRAPAVLDPVVVIDARPGEDPRDELDQTEALLRYLWALHTSGAQVVDRDSGSPRPMRWGDVMILLPTWTRAGEVYDRLLEARIPCHVEGGRTFFERDEIRLCIAALRAIVEPAETREVLFVLRGLFGLSFQDLLAHRRAGGSWRYVIGEQPEGPVAEALRVLREVHRTRNFVRPWAWLERVLRHTQAPAVWSLGGRGAAALANLDKLRALLRELELVARTPGELVAMLEGLRAGGGEDLSLADHDTDAVRLTSLFKAKGLEAPIVALVHASRRSDPVQHVFDREAATLSVKIRDLVPPGWSERAALEQEARGEERRRWMYVAATRARDQLVVVDAGEKFSTLYSPDLRRGLPGALAACANDARVEVAPGVMVRAIRPQALAEAPRQREAFPGHDTRVDALLAAAPHQADGAGERRAARVRDAVAASRTRSTRWRSVTSLAARRRLPNREMQVDGAVEPQHMAGLRVGASGGRLVHSVIEQLDLHHTPDALGPRIEALCAALGRDMGLSQQRIEDCRTIIRQILEHEVMLRVRESGEHWQEVPFAHRDRGRIVTGVIDLCVPLDASRREWLVVDFKTHIPPEGSPLREQYRDQVARYARAMLATVAGCERVETQLVGPFPALVEMDQPEGFAEVLEELRPGLERLLAAGAPTPEVARAVDGFAELVLELAWPEREPPLGLVADVDPPELEALQAAGWQIVSCAYDDRDDIERAFEALSGILGLTEDGLETATDDESDVPETLGESSEEVDEASLE